MSYIATQIWVVLYGFVIHISLLAVIVTKKFTNLIRMNFKILAVISFVLISVMSFSQDTTNMKYIRFYQYLNQNKELSQKQLTAIFQLSRNMEKLQFRHQER